MIISIKEITTEFESLRDLIIGDNEWDPNYGGYQYSINESLDMFLEEVSDEDAAAIRDELRSMGYNV